MNLVDNQVGDAVEAFVEAFVEQLAQHDARRAEEQRRRRRAFALQPDGVAHGTARHLAALGGDAFGDAERRDAARLRHNDVARQPTLGGVLEQCRIECVAASQILLFKQKEQTHQKTEKKRKKAKS